MAESFVKLSGSTDGKGVKLAHTSSASAETIHTAQASSTLADIVTLFVYNGDTQTRTFVAGWGGTTDPDNTIKVPIPAGQGAVLAIDRQPIYNSQVITAWCPEAANVLVVYGMVVRQS